jgi:hypothetical protein
LSLPRRTLSQQILLRSSLWVAASAATFDRLKNLGFCP